MTQEELLKIATDNVDFTIDQMDTQRRAGLDELKTFQQAKQNILVKEKARLAGKLGEDHPKVTAIGVKIRDIENRTKEADVLITEANTEVRLVDEKTWMVHGKVVDKGGIGMPGLTAALYDEKGTWQKETGYACTDKQGYFAIRYTPDPKTQTAATTGKNLYLYISKNHKILYKDAAPLVVTPGQIDYRAICISGEDDICVPPEPEPGQGPGQPQPGEPSSDDWVASGYVTDKQGNGIPGLTVSLYDKDLVFDDYLGTRKTIDKGYFEFIYRKESFKNLFDSSPDIYLKVFDASGKKTLYSTKKAVKCNAGRTEVFNISIDSVDIKKT